MKKFLLLVLLTTACSVVLAGCAAGRLAGGDSCPVCDATAVPAKTSAP